MKYNRTREDCFQIRTEIREKNGTREVRKTALYPEGKAHIQSFEEKYQVLDRQNPSPETGKTGASGRGDDSGLSVFRGKNAGGTSGRNSDCPVAADAEVSAIRAAMDEIYSIRPEERKPFAVTPEFIKVFNALGELDPYRDKETEKWRRMGFFRGSSCGRELQRLQH